MGYGKMINILFEDNHLLVVEKPINVPVCLDDSKDDDLLNQLKKYLQEKYNKPGNAYLALVHRLDRPVSGVMVFAKTSKAAARLAEQIRNHQFIKEYLAVVIGKTPKTAILTDYLLKNKDTNTTTINKKGKYAELSYQLIKQNQELSLIKITLKTGRSHQIRVQLNHQGFPLYGDQRYNLQAKKGEQIALHASSLTIIHPTTKELMTFSCPCARYPFNLN
ncbi:MAG: RluA family pseudouridine synthase [Erysipelotrichaceae bacterium]